VRKWGVEAAEGRDIYREKKIGRRPSKNELGALGYLKMSRKLNLQSRGGQVTGGATEATSPANRSKRAVERRRPQAKSYITSTARGKGSPGISRNEKKGQERAGGDHVQKKCTGRLQGIERKNKNEERRGRDAFLTKSLKKNVVLRLALLLGREKRVTVGEPRADVLKPTLMSKRDQAGASEAPLKKAKGVTPSKGSAQTSRSTFPTSRCGQTRESRMSGSRAGTARRGNREVRNLDKDPSNL